MKNYSKTTQKLLENYSKSIKKLLKTTQKVSKNYSKVLKNY